MNEWMNEWINDQGVCGTAPAKPGLLIMSAAKTGRGWAFHEKHRESCMEVENEDDSQEFFFFAYFVTG